MRSWFTSLFAGAEPPAPPEPPPAPSWTSRRSSGLHQYLHAVCELRNLKLLDLGCANHATIEYLGDFGHSIYSADILYGLEHFCGPSGIGNELQAHEFLEECCDFRVADFDGALVWDTLQYLEPGLREAVVRRLHATLLPGSLIFGLFHTSDGSQKLDPPQVFQILSPHELAHQSRHTRLPAYPITVRQVDKLFENFAGVNYFLGKGSLREVVIRR